ncbi:hypothetical protein D3C86_1184190 [compost metagenome]
MSFAGIGFEHAVANEAEAHPGNHRDLANAFGDFQRSGQDIGGRGRAAHHFEQAHDIGRAEEVQADDVLWPARDGGNGVDIQGGSIAGENRPRLAHLIQGTKHLLLDRQILEDGFDHQVSVGDIGVVQSAVDQCQSLLHLLGCELAALDTGFVVFAD